MTLRLIFAPQALADLIRLREFLALKNPTAAKAARDRILQAVELIHGRPLVGRPVRQRKDLREIVIPFGRAGYLMRYQITPQDLRILRIWHTREQRTDR